MFHIPITNKGKNINKQIGQVGIPTSHVESICIANHSTELRYSSPSEQVRGSLQSVANTWQEKKLQC